MSLLTEFRPNTAVDSPDIIKPEDRKRGPAPAGLFHLAWARTELWTSSGLGLDWVWAKSGLGLDFGGTCVGLKLRVWKTLGLEVWGGTTYRQLTARCQRISLSRAFSKTSAYSFNSESTCFPSVPSCCGSSRRACRSACTVLSPSAG